MTPPRRPHPGPSPTPVPDAEALLASPDAMVDIAAAALHARAAELDAQGDVRGLDAWPELRFHPALAHAFTAAGLGVAREAVYPGQVEDAARRRALRRERERCDLVLLPRPGGRLLDPVSDLVERDELSRTLFGMVEAPPDPAAVRVEDAYWLEVKVVGQFCFTDGWSGPNKAYSTELVRALRDADKLAEDPRITRGAVLVVLFTADRRTADHDLRVAWDRAAERGSGVRHFSAARFPITDRIGNALCTLCWTPASCGTAAADGPGNAAGAEGGD